MATGQITWEQFITVNNDARGVRYKFEDLCRQLFTYEFLSKNKIQKYVHSNPNNPGIESEPILNEETDKYIGYQAKFFTNEVGYSQIKESAEKAVKHYKGKLDIIYLFCNKSVTTTRDSFKEIVNLLKDAGIEIQLITDTTILDLVRKYPSLGKYYFDDHGISHEWLVNEADRVIDVLGERFNADFNVDTAAERNLSIFLQNHNAIDYFNNRKRELVKKIAQLKWELEDFYAYAHKFSEFMDTIPDVKQECIHDVETWQNTILKTFEEDIAEINEKIETKKAKYEQVKNNDKKEAYRLNEDLSKLEKLKKLFYQLELSESEKRLLNNSILIVEGKSGIGKTHLFANEANLMLKAGENALLIIGGDYLSDNNIFEQLKSNLRLDFNFENLVDILEVLGETNGKIVAIFIDALNESWKPQLWKSVLPRLYNKICSKKYVRLAISFRSEYEKVLLTEQFFKVDNVVKIEHTGFMGNSFKAVRKFLGHYGIPFAPVHMFSRNIYNPLFLTLYCKTYQGDEVDLPILYERILEKANEKFAKVIEKTGYDPSYNIVLPVIEAISKQTLFTGKRHFEKSELEGIESYSAVCRQRLFTLYEKIKKYCLL